jgi:Acyclic terpene utilisation family protein AtuA
MSTVRIGNGCGFWGDSPEGPYQLVSRGKLDFLTLDYLAEVALSILTKQMRKNPEAGFAYDFVEALERIGPLWRDQPGLRIVTNAGGVNPRGCARACAEVMRRHGLDGRKIALVTGDDLMPDLDGYMADGFEFKHMETGEPLGANRNRLVSANAYIGVRPIVQALADGADLVLAGRVTDPALALGPAIHAHGWHEDNWNRLAGGTVAGHLIECGTQVTGGISTNWLDIPDPAGIGFPIVEVSADGLAVVTKPEGTGGRVTEHTVKEQLLYEIGDPKNFITPDVIVDFTSLRVQDLGDDRVLVSGARGRPPGDDFKVSAALVGGYMASGELTVFGERAVEKATRAGESVIERLRRVGVQFESTRVECLRTGASVPGASGPGTEEADRGVTEVGLRVTVQDRDQAKVRRFSRELASLITAGPPGTTGYAAGRPRVREVLAYWPSLVPKDWMKTDIEMIEV